jgi:hypothetical protein
MLELDAGVLGREAPIDPTTGAVARRLGLLRRWASLDRRSMRPNPHIPQVTTDRLLVAARATKPLRQTRSLHEVVPLRARARRLYIHTDDPGLPLVAD